MSRHPFAKGVPIFFKPIAHSIDHYWMTSGCVVTVAAM